MYVRSFLQLTVMMFPYSGHSPTSFSVNAPSVLAKSSDDVVNSFYISKNSSVNNRTSASLHVMLDSSGSSFIYSHCLFCMTKPTTKYYSGLNTALLE